ncbi:5-formyltetrahydrofolate cyclo-ligase [Bacillus luteus]|uniref:5-formyltetrahydrofolate cyclo-ligase n=2 Tax=Alkalicoccus luteus TaxID=1237094 RepID=A0A969TV31_9BACI|nr:5-formyltetrahydrofolate cyclo-ligase [Alkalicoccus luteus]
MKAKRESLPAEDRAAFDRQLQHELFYQSSWAKADSIGITVSVGSETDTSAVITRAWQEGKLTAAPVVEKGKMVFRYFSAMEELVAAPFGLLEPVSGKLAEKEDIDMIIVPGLAFNTSGYRLGYGGGYFDKYLSNYSGSTVSLVYPFQLIDSLPVEAYDIAVGKLLVAKEQKK